MVGFGALAIASVVLLLNANKNLLSTTEYYSIGGAGGFLTTSGTIVGSLIGGTLSTVLADKKTETVSGDYEHFRTILPRLLKNAAFESRTSELQMFITENNSPPEATPWDTSFTEAEEPTVENAVYYEWASILFCSSLSINYERAIAPHFSIRLGYGLGGSLDFDGGGSSGAGPMLMAVFLSGGQHKLEVGIGASLLNIKTNNDRFFDWWIYPAASIGYRYHPADAGVLVRLVLTYDYYFGTPVGLSIGYVF